MRKEISIKVLLFILLFLSACNYASSMAANLEKENPANIETERQKAQEVTLSELTSKPFVYRLEKDDTLDISVWRHPELSKEATVNIDGMVSYPFVGDIQAAGLTLSELREKIAQGLTEFSQMRLKPSSGKGEGKGGYLIGLGDALEISVWKIEDLSRDAIVRPDGMISYPLLGDLRAAGLSLTELDELITRGLNDYVKDPQVSVMVKSFGWKQEASKEVSLEADPQVSVTIKKFGGRKVIILGDVAKPGVYPFSSQIRLVEALALAGDATKYAVKKNILIIRGDIHNSPTVISSDILAFFKKGKVSENVLIQPQDVIFVPRSLIGNINTFLESIAPLVDTAYKGLFAQDILTD